jgi:MFS family permease
VGVVKHGICRRSTAPLSAVLTRAAQFNSYQLYTALQTMQIVIIATGKFPIAKFSDIFGRAEGYMLALFLYVLGFIIVAASHGFATLMAGVVFYAFGSTGVQIMNQTLLADMVTTQWRGFAIGIVSLPYVINFAVAPRIVNQLAPFANPVHWRWGPGS